MNFLCFGNVFLPFLGMQTLSKQVNALAKLSSTPGAIVNTWSASKLALEVETCTRRFAAEHQLKKLVTGR